MFLIQLLIGALLVGLTVVIHAIALDQIRKVAEHMAPSIYKRFHKFWKAPVLVVTVLSIFCAHIIQIWLWAGFYMIIQVFPDFESALYFSTSTFTTVGYGDLVLDKDWRLISSFQSANGFILFGWSTAFIYEIMSKLYEHESIRKT